MKTRVLTTIFVLGLVLEASAIGHPHNLFAARKQMKAKKAALSQSLTRSATSSRTATYVKATALISAICASFYKKAQ